MVIEIDAKELTSKMTVNVRLTGARLLQLRIKIACWFLALGARIAGFGLKVEEIEDGESEHPDLTIT